MRITDFWDTESGQRILVAVALTILLVGTVWGSR